MDMTNLIPSPSVRKYLAEIGHSFSLAEQATLIFNNPLLRQDIRIDSLREIVDKLHSSENSEKIFTVGCHGTISAKELAAQIESVINNELEMELTLFRNRLEGIYEACFKEKSNKSLGYSFSRCGFSSIDNAVRYVRENAGDSLESYKITLFQIDNPNKYVQGTFNEKGEILNFDSSFMGEDIFSDKIFTDFYVDVPYPFKNGDIVQNLKTKEIAVVNHLGIASQPRPKPFPHSDISDVNLYVDALNDEGLFFYHDHFYTPLIDYAAVDEKSDDGEFLKEASLLVSGKDSLEYFTMLVQKRIIGRIL